MLCYVLCKSAQPIEVTANTGSNGSIYWHQIWIDWFVKLLLFIRLIFLFLLSSGFFLFLFLCSNPPTHVLCFRFTEFHNESQSNSQCPYQTLAPICLVLHSSIHVDSCKSLHRLQHICHALELPLMKCLHVREWTRILTVEITSHSNIYAKFWILLSIDDNVKNVGNEPCTQRIQL